jgi:non-heme chloroperoxidase
MTSTKFSPSPAQGAASKKPRPSGLVRIARWMLLPILAALILVAAIAYGGPKALPAMPSINDPFRTVDFSGLPPLSHFQADDGEALAYRHYVPNAPSAKGSVVLVHGSSASSESMHLLATAFAKAGLSTYTLDVRGHGASGTKGQIGYIGQLEDDLSTFVRTVAPAKPATLAGFSSGGGFVLRFAGSDRQESFDSYLLLAPFLSQDAPTYRSNSGGWVDVGIPRIVAISILNSFGIQRFNELPVMRFALSEKAKEFLTPAYSFALATNFRPHGAYINDIKSVNRPCVVLAGADDELFETGKFEPVFRSAGKMWPVTLLPGIGHTPLTLEPAALDAAVEAVQRMQRGGV